MDTSKLSSFLEGEQGMIFTRTAMAVVTTLAAAAMLAACGGGNSNSSSTSSGASPGASPGNGGNTKSSGTQVKQLNPLHKLHNAMSNKVLNINMGAMNGSKQDGTASIGIKGNGIQVTVHLNNEPKGASEPSHIHQGTCTKLDPAPWKPLKNVVGGTATTFVSGVTVAQLKKAHYAINVHKSANDLKTYVSCGDITP